MVIVSDSRNPCNCGSAVVPNQYQNEADGKDYIECQSCGSVESVVGYDACISQWNAVHITHTWDDIIANGGPIS
jgi:hypothetical protein